MTLIALGKRLTFKDIHSDKSYQRPLDVKAVKRIADNFSEDVLDELLINQRSDGSFFCVDGQHRLSAIQLLIERGTLDPDWGIPSRIVSVGGQKEEAALYAVRSRGTKTTSSLAYFWCDVMSGDANALSLKEEVERAQCVVARAYGKSQPNTVCCISDLQRIFRREPNLLCETLNLVRALWSNEGEWRDGGTLLGVACFIYSRRTHSNWDLALIQETLKKTSLAVILGYATRLRLESGGRSSKAEDFAIAMQEEYNRLLGRKQRKLSVIRKWQ